MKSIVTYFTQVQSPIGRILLTATDMGLCGLHLMDHDHTPKIQKNWIQNDTKFSDVKRQLKLYFVGALHDFTVQFDLKGTEFQKKVWLELFRIPYGTVISYRELAERIGHPKAVRAVGSANGKNPISIIIPCHRVIASGGGLGGYGWGLPIKTQLLQLEKVKLATSLGESTQTA